MGIFGKKRENEFDSLHNNDIFNEDDDIIVPAGRRNLKTTNVGNGSIQAPHAITADELLGTKNPETIVMEHTGPNSVYERIKERKQQSEVTAIEDDYVPSWATAKKESETPATEEKKVVVSNIETKVEKTPAHVTSIPTAKVTESSHSAFSDAFLERCRVAVEKASAEDEAARHTPQKPIEEINPEPTPAPTVAETSTPSTRSVDEIIKMLRGKADETVEDTSPAKTAAETKTIAEPETVIDDEISAETNRKVEVEVIPTDSDSDIMHTTTPRMVDSDVKVYGKIVKGAVIQQTPDGDVEGTEFVKPKVTQDTIVAEDKTIMFGDLGDIISKRADDEFTTSKYSDDDFEDEEDFLDDTSYYEINDPELDGIEDYKSINDAAKLLTKLSEEKSNHKTLTVFSLVAVAIMLLFATLFNGSIAASSIRIVNLIAFAATLLVNYNIFFDVKKIFKGRPGFDSAVAVTSSVLLVQTVISTFVYNGAYDGLAIAGVVLLTACRLTHLLKTSRILKGLKLIANSDDKRAVVSVSGKNAQTVASGAVQSEAIVLSGRKAVNIKNYIKSCEYASPIDLKVKTLLIVAVILSAVTLLAIGFLMNFGIGLTVAALVLLCMFPATALFTCELPMYFTTSKANELGAMLAGYKGAYELNLANLVAVSSSDLFPEGSVSLYNMKTLSENEIGKTLLDAGAVSEAANSPLCSIFKSIIGNEYKSARPKVNGVKYEDKMGISGWIGERTILIGNRNLMQGHNVSVPPASVDQKILRAGYFPVYIAIDGKPCLLFIVKYDTDPEVTAELQALCNTGMTVVVDPKDPNTSSAMICDYFGIPDDALKVMNHNGRVAYEQTTAKTESCSAPATFGENICGFFRTVTSAIKLNTTYRIMTAIFVIAAVLGAVLLIALALTSKLALVNTLTVGGFEILFAVISGIIAKVRSCR
ncbi:MAG: hypothetical protein IIX60_00425 [Clostridia bacterium]|nr:hypothetical protein [Clostridia bacterium]